MKSWFSADYHLGHDNIRKYCHRPFKTLEEMDNTLINNWNARVSPDDTVIHLGDFCFKNSPGGKSGEGSITKSSSYMSRLNGNKVMVRGNHDRNNSTKAIIESMMIKHGGLEMFLTHIPPDNTFAVPDFTDLILCGHVHGAWKHKVIKYPESRPPMMILNVGVDVWNFRPIDINEIIEYLAKVPEWKEIHGGMSSLQD